MQPTGLKDNQPRENKRQKVHPQPVEYSANQNPEAGEALICKIFTNVSSLKSAYIQLQAAHTPYDPDKIQASDKVNKDSEILQFEQMIKEASQKRAKLEKNLKLRGLSTKESEGSGDENDFYSVDLTPELFTSAIETAFKAIHNFSKPLINMMKAAGWDLDAAANSIESNVVYAKRAHQ
ncbi:hypothetical protein Peur_059856 [Populus x canadensis]